jgi:hypothetical protein
MECILGKLPSSKLPDYDEQVKEIMECFEWSTVRSVMVHLNWTWCGNKKPPTINKMKDTARKLLSEAWQYKGVSITGGFNAEYCEGELRLSFEVDSWPPNFNM